jgi:hypothetical protein
MLQVSSGVIVLFLHLEGISSPMILDLEAEKSVNSSKRVDIARGYSHLRTAIGISALYVILTFNRFMSSTPGGTVAWINIGMAKSPCENITAIIAKC